MRRYPALLEEIAAGYDVPGGCMQYSYGVTAAISSAEWNSYGPILGIHIHTAVIVIYVEHRMPRDHCFSETGTTLG